MGGTADIRGILDAVREPYGLGEKATAAPLGNGHINQTVLVRDGGRHLVAQRINKAVFPDPGALVRNARAIGDHLLGRPGTIPVARHVPGRDGAFLHGPDRSVRVLEYFPDSRSVQVLESAGQAGLAARCFARFSAQLTGFDPGRLEIVIPGFHSPGLRWRQFCEALERDVAGRAPDCPGDIRFVRGREKQVGHWQLLMDGLPQRVCHNDCKINNMLVHRSSGEALAIIDLDTCMPGRLMCDFGDLVRSCCSPEAEDSPRLDRVRARPEIYAALEAGYLQGLEGIITPDERASLPQGALMMCFLVGLRFLTDHLSGDGYFGADYPGHNLVRARNQFRLYRSLAEGVAA